MAHKRIYQLKDQDNPQWYFKVRGDRTRGPFISYDAAERDLNTFIKVCKKRTRLRFNWSRLFTGFSLKRNLPDNR